MATITGGTNYGGAQLPAPTTIPSNLFQGLGVAAPLDLSGMQLQTFKPKTVDTGEYDALKGINNYLSGISTTDPTTHQSYAQDWASGASLKNMSDALTRAGLNNSTDFSHYFGSINPYNLNAGSTGVGQINDLMNTLNSGIKNTQNSNVAGYNATNATNAKTGQNLQQAAIAENRLLGELNKRGLLNSFTQGGAGTADMNLLQNMLYGSADEIGSNLQNELSGLQQGDQTYEMQLANYMNGLGNFSKYKQSQQPGLTDIIGLGASALPVVGGIASSVFK